MKANLLNAFSQWNVTTGKIKCKTCLMKQMWEVCQINPFYVDGSIPCRILWNNVLVSQLLLPTFHLCSTAFSHNVKCIVQNVSWKFDFNGFDTIAPSDGKDQPSLM